MAKKSTKIALTYVITILCTLLIIGGICYMLMEELLAPKENEESLPIVDPMVSSGEEYTPSPEDSMTSLFIYDSRKRISGSCFVVVRLSADSRQIIIMPIPSDTFAEVDGTSNSVYEFYRTGGTGKAVSAVGAATGLEIERYIKFDDNSFETFASIFGNMSYNIPYNMIYTDPDTGEETIYRAGETFIDPNDIRKLITYPLYDSGEEYRAKITGLIMSELINKNVYNGFSDYVDDYFNEIINSTIETNYTAYDYKEQSDAMKFIAESSERVVKLVTVSGAYNEDQLFVLDEDFIRAIPEWLKLGGEQQ